MSGEDGWVLLPAGSRLEGWLPGIDGGAPREAVPIEVVAWSPERRLLATESGDLVGMNKLDQSRPGPRPHQYEVRLALGGTPVTAGPGWWCGRSQVLFEPSGEHDFTVRAEWSPVLVWLVNDATGATARGIYAGDEGDLTDYGSNNFYWHEAQGIEYRNALEEQLVAEETDRIARLRARGPVVPPPPSIPVPAPEGLDD